MVKPNNKKQHSSRPSSNTQNTHSYSTEPMTSPARPTSSASLVALPSEDAGVCVVCEDECTCGAARSTMSSIKKPLLTLPSPPPKREFDDDSDISSVLPDAYASSSLASKKKRGRPSKADVLARKVAAKAATASQLNMTPSEPNSKSPFSKSPTITKKRPSGNNKSLSRASGKVNNSRRLPPATFSSDNDDDDDEFSDHSTQFPTFLPASVLGSDLSSDDSESLSSDEVDSAIEAEEEELIMAEETLAMHKLRTRRERVDGMGETVPPDTSRRWDKMNWNSRERQTSVAGSVVNDVNGASGSDEVDSDEGDDDEEEEEDIDMDVFPAPIHDWSEEEEEYDADVFFANLSDSSFGSSSDSEPNLPTVNRNGATDVQSDMDSFSFLEAGEAGLSPDFEQLRRNSQLPLVVTEDWDGQLIFAHGMKDGEGASDVHFDTNARSAQDNGADADEADGEDTEVDSESEDSEIEGNTTEEEEPTPGHPAPPVEPTSPDILASRLSASTSQSSATSKTTLIMGSFAISPLETARSAIIDGLREVFIPSPYPRVKKQRDGWRGKKRSASGQSDLFLRVAKRPRQSSLPDTTRSQTTGSKRRLSNASDEPHVQSSPELPPPPPIELDDVLNAALLGDNSEEDSDAFTSLMPSTRFFANLTRWDRVPISTFRRLRTAAAFDAGSSPGHSSSATLGSPRLADGFSYGSTASVGPVSPYANASLSSVLWESSFASPSNKPKGKGHEMGHASGLGSGRGRSKKRKVLISPVIFPVKDDVANLSGSQPFPLSPHEARTMSKRQRREEDKKSTGLFDSALNSPPSKLPGLPVPSLLSLDH